jgi:peptidoglycan/LPS O-acetylase OafA/YrhL
VRPRPAVAAERLLVGLFDRRLWSGRGRTPEKVHRGARLAERRIATIAVSVTIDQSPVTGDEAGTPPGDRPFRPDVQGLRAVAVALVVLFHANIPGLRGGYVGVDVFFVISGFVITGVLLRERTRVGSTSLLHFYTRRIRRILPAASLVIIASVIAAYVLLGSVSGNQNAIDARWASVFLINVHFAATGTNYLASQAPPSVLQNYWSLAVEEQFYLLYPAIFLVVAGLSLRGSLRRSVGWVLGAAIVVSFVWSILQTSNNPTAAFFSPLPRVWELALGGLVAISTVQLRRLPATIASALSWLGLGSILLASVVFSAATPYPGWRVALPVCGAALVIVGGTVNPTHGVERLLGLRPFQWIGLISFSLYLWHWPILEIATQRRGVATLPTWDDVMLVLVSVVLAALTYQFIENPVRHSRFLVSRRWASLIMGLCLIASTLTVATVELNRHPTVSFGAIAQATTGSICRSPSPSDVAHLRSTYAPGSSQKDGKSELKSVVVVGDSTACSLLIGLQAVGPSYGMQFENGAVIGCGIVSGVIAPFYLDGHNIVAYTTLCQGQANRAESVAVERYHPRLILWGSTEERSAIVVNTAHGTKVLASGSPEWRSVMLQRMDTRVNKFLATGARVILTLAAPAVHPADHTVNSEDEDYAHMNSLLKEVAAKHPHRVAVVDLSPRVCPTGPPCQDIVPAFNPKPTSVTQTVRADGTHYLPNASLWVARWLVPRIYQATKGLS